MATSGEKLARKVIAETGVQLLAQNFTGKGHIKCRVRNDMSQEMNYIFSSSTCSGRAYTNALADLKRFARGALIQPERKAA